MRSQIRLPKNYTSDQECSGFSVITGRFDVIVTVWLPSSRESFAFIQTEVGALEGIGDTETRIRAIL